MRMPMMDSSRVSKTEKNCQDRALSLPGLMEVEVVPSPAVQTHLDIEHQQKQQLTVGKSTSEVHNKALDCICSLSHLAAFGIIGALIRYGLEKLFSPSTAAITSNNSIVFSDLPPNMVTTTKNSSATCSLLHVQLGSFFMGWLGIVFKEHIAGFSEHLALGLTTGLLGSITTFASWCQSMLSLVTAGYWLRAICGFLLGMELCIMSLIVGRDTAAIVLRLFQSPAPAAAAAAAAVPSCISTKKQLELSLLLSTSLALWLMACLLASYSNDKLWVACSVAPLGVWTRWWLSSLNVKGFSGRLAWFPLGTFAANLAACTAEFLISALQLLLAPNSRFAVVCEGVKFGMLGCLSTVSTLVAEVYLLHQGAERWRSYVYACTSAVVAFAIGLLTFSTIVWSRH